MTWLAIWAAGFFGIHIGGRRLMRSEPTAHGQIVGRMVLLAASIAWSMFVALAWVLS